MLLQKYEKNENYRERINSQKIHFLQSTYIQEFTITSFR